MTQIIYGNLDLTDAVYNELAFYDQGSAGVGLADGVLEDQEIADISATGDTLDGLAVLQDKLQPYGYRLVVSSNNVDDTYLVQPNMDCPDGQRYIPDSVFEMGSVDGQRDELPVHEVGVSGFCADKTETRNAPFSDWVANVPQQKPQSRFEAKEVCTTTSRTVVATTAEAAEAKAKRVGVDANKTTCETQVENQTPRAEVLANNSSSGFGGGDQPVVSVDWKTAVAYCASRKDLNGLPMWLPTEAEQELMLRDPLDGEISHETANYNSRGTQNVGSYPQDGWGLYDVHGNVWEWGADWYGDYSNNFQQDPTGPSTGNYRVLRGGSWLYYEDYLRSSYRGYGYPDHGDNGIGFRCVSSPRTPEE